MEILKQKIKALEAEVEGTSLHRKRVLDQIITYIRKQQSNNQSVQLMFVCTHNSRRSQFGQIWTAILSAHYGLNLLAFSGGTEVTKTHATVLDVFKQLQVPILSEDETTNQKHLIHIDNKTITVFSKLYNHPHNPKSNFAALMTCSEAAENCPYIQGCDLRIPLSYDDPKIFDGTNEELNAYQKTSDEVARELVYVFMGVKALT